MSWQSKHSLDEQAAASAVASLCASMKRPRAADTTGGVDAKKRREGEGSFCDGPSDSPNLDRTNEEQSIRSAAKICPGLPGAPEPSAGLVPPAFASASTVSDDEGSSDEAVTGSSPNGDPRKLRGAPFFFYRNFSTIEDDDPLSPLTPPGRVPNFPAKMHAILSRGDLAEIVAWAPHGRAFRVLKPRQFEVRVIPTYFEHSKFSSFVRQANGWGFKRITQGPDRNCYYHEMFLQGMPHLCKKMKRPGASGKLSADPEHEPDLYKISEMFPVQGCPQTDGQAILLESTVQGGPKARMPVHMGLLMVSDAAKAAPTELVAKPKFQRELATAVDMNTDTEEDCKIAAKPSAPPASLKTVSMTEKHAVIAPKPMALPLRPLPGTQPIAQKLASGSKVPAPPLLAPKPPSVTAASSAPPVVSSTVQTPSVPVLMPPYYQAAQHCRQQLQPNNVQPKELVAPTTPAVRPLPPVAPVAAGAPSAIPPLPLAPHLAAQVAASSVCPLSATAALPTPTKDQSGASQFAAGFAAATALNGSAVQAVLHQALSGAAEAVRQTQIMQQLHAVQIAQLQLQVAQAQGGQGQSLAQAQPPPQSGTAAAAAQAAAVATMFPAPGAFAPQPSLMTSKVVVSPEAAAPGLGVQAFPASTSAGAAHPYVFPGHPKQHSN